MKKIKVIPLFVILILLNVLIITPTIFAKIIKTSEGVIITHYPDKFHETGILYSIDNRGIVIDDIFIPFATHVRYMTPHKYQASVRDFESGDKVGYLLNDKQQIILLCLL